MWLRSTEEDSHKVFLVAAGLLPLLSPILIAVAIISCFSFLYTGLISVQISQETHPIT